MYVNEQNCRHHYATLLKCGHHTVVIVHAFTAEIKRLATVGVWYATTFGLMRKHKLREVHVHRHTIYAQLVEVAHFLIDAETAKTLFAFQNSLAGRAYGLHHVSIAGMAVESEVIAIGLDNHPSRQQPVIGHAAPLHTAVKSHLEVTSLEVHKIIVVAGICHILPRCKLHKLAIRGVCLASYYNLVVSHFHPVNTRCVSGMQICVECGLFFFLGFFGCKPLVVGSLLVGCHRAQHHVAYADFHPCGSAWVYAQEIARLTPVQLLNQAAQVASHCFP